MGDARNPANGSLHGLLVYSSSTSGPYLRTIWLQCKVPSHDVTFCARLFVVYTRRAALKNNPLPK